MPIGLRNARGRVQFRDVKGRYIRSPGGGVRIFDQIGPRLGIGPLVTESAVFESLELMVDDIEQWMKENAPWDDRSGDARDGLRAEVIRGSVGGLTATEIAIMVYHTVSYGLYLEVRWNGRYAIINPTIERWGPAMMHQLKIF